MNNLLEKARSGRTNALAGLAANLGDASSEAGTGARFVTKRKIDMVPFVSKRAQTNNSAWLH
ncbi:MAG: hypothetical protein ACSHXD_17375 [Marinosulfonomonas sp.]